MKRPNSRKTRTAVRSSGMVLRRLAGEFDADAESMERIAAAYRKKGMTEQYDILWHEGAIYRNCSDRLRAEAQNCV